MVPSDMTVLRPRYLTVLLWAVGLAACGGTAGGGSSAVSASHNALPTAPTSPVQLPAPAASVSPSASPPGASSPLPTQAVAPVPPMPVVPATSRSVPLTAVGDTAAHGTVQVTIHAGRAAIAVFVAGLPPNTAHAVHLHFGACPSAGSHIFVLGTLRANGSGSGSVVGAVDAAFAGPGHFVIVYTGPAAGPLGACASLA